MPLVVSREAQHEITHALLHVAVEPFRRRAGRSRKRPLALLRQIPIAVISFQKTVDALLCLARIVIDREGKIAKKQSGIRSREQFEREIKALL